MRRDEEPEQLLSCINAFAVSFCKACRDNERAEHLRKKQEAAARSRKETTASRKLPLKKPANTANHMMSNIQGSLRRGEFAMMKQLQAQMSKELSEKMGMRRRNSNYDDESLRRPRPK